MSYLHQEQPIILSGRNRSPLPLGAGSVDITLVDRSHRWALIDKISIQVNSRLEDVQNGQLFPFELIAALYEAKIGTKLVSLTDDFVPLLAMTQMQAVGAETEAFTDCASFIGEGLPTVPTPLNFIEWVLPRPLLLRPGEALRVTIRQNSVPTIGAVGAMTSAYVALGDAAGDPIAPVGAFFDVAAKGVLVDIKAPMTKTRQVPYLVARTFDARNVNPATAQGGGAEKQELSLENNTKRLLRMHSLLGRWLDWNNDRLPQGHIMMQSPDADAAFSDVLQPLVSIRDYAGYDIVRDVPFRSVFPPQVAGVLQFQGAMQERDILKLSLSRDPRNGSAFSQFFDSVQGIIALNAWREEPI